MIDRPDIAMVISPHPDDAEIGCGGTVAKWAAEGTRVVYVICTNGDKGTSDLSMTPATLAAIREDEQRKAAEVLGVAELVFLRHPDGGLEDTSEFRGQLVRSIRMFRPDLVLCPDPYRRTFYLHRDHRVCGHVSLDAVFPYARDHLNYPEHLVGEGLQSHKVADVMLWGAEEPDEYIEITDTLELKIEALMRHVSQVSASMEEEKAFLESMAVRSGQQGGFQYAEAFRRIQIRD